MTYPNKSLESNNVLLESNNTLYDLFSHNRKIYYS